MMYTLGILQVSIGCSFENSNINKGLFPCIFNYINCLESPVESSIIIQFSYHEWNFMPLLFMFDKIPF